MPVHECAVGIVFPRPDMQGVERGETEAVRELEIMKELTHKLWRTLLLCIPRFGENQKIGTDQSQSSAWRRLVDHDLRMHRVEFAAVYQSSVHIVKPHRSRIRSAYTAKLKDIAFRLGYGHILKALGRFPDNFDKSARPAFLFRCLFLL